MTSISEIALMRQKDVERLLAASVMIDPVLAVQSCGWLDPDVIVDERVKAYWKQIKAQVRPDFENDAAVQMSVTALLELGMLDAMNWQNELPTSTMPVVFANELIRRNYLSQVTISIGKLMQSVQRADDTGAREIIQELAGMSVEKKTYMPTMLEIAAKFDKVVNGGNRSINSHIIPFDRATGGLERQTLTVFAGRPSTGKTALAWQIAQTVAYGSKKVLFFSLEMSEVSIMARACCPKIGVTWRDVRAERITAEQRDRLTQEAYAHGLQFEDRLRLKETDQTTASIWQIVSEYRPDLVVVDHLRLLGDTGPNEVKRLGLASQNLKKIATAFNCAVIVLAQLNRQSETREVKRPILADLRDSGEIEENADLVVMLHHEEFGGNERRPDAKSPTELWIRKFREGPRDILVRLLFNAKDEWFEEPEK